MFNGGIHTGIVVPKQAAGVDWRPLMPAGHLADPRYGAYDYLSKPVEKGELIAVLRTWMKRRLPGATGP